MEQQSALVLEKSEWDRIRAHMQYLNKGTEYAEQQHLLREKMKDKSASMIKDWDNTVRNVRERRLACNKARLEAIEKRKNDIQQAFRQEQAAEKKEFLEKCQKEIYYGKDNVKTLNKALGFSKVLKIRESQIDFKNKQKVLEEKKDKEYAEKCKRDAEEYRKEKELEKKKDLEKKNKVKEDLLAQMRMKEEEKLEEQREKEQERQDLINIKKEIDAAEECVEAEKAVQKESYRKIIQDYLDKEAEYKETQKQKEELKNKLIEIYGSSKRKITRMQKEKETEMRNDALKRREKISDYLAKLIERKDTGEEKAIQKAIAEKEAKLEEQRMKKEAYEQRLKEGRIQAYKDFLVREAEAKKEEQEIRKWEMMQRFKENEANKENEEKKHAKNLQDIKETRKFFKKQIEEREEFLRKECEEDIELSNYSIKLYNADDEAFLAYAKELIEETKQKGRNLLPLLNKVEEYKKRNGLVQTKKVPPMLKSRTLFNTAPEPPRELQPQSWGPCAPKDNVCLRK